MLFTEQDLSVNNAWTILENATYLSEYESNVNPQTIPVKEVSRLGYGIVRFDDVEKLSEDYGCDYIDAMYAIAEASDMNPEYLAVAVPEEEIIAYPEIVNELANIVIQPLSEYDYEYQYVTECVDAWLESGNDEYLGLLLEMPQDQWDYVASQSDLTDEQQKAIGAKWMGDKRVNPRELQKAIQKYRSRNNRKGNYNGQVSVTPIKNSKLPLKILANKGSTKFLAGQKKGQLAKLKYQQSLTPAKIKARFQDEKQSHAQTKQDLAKAQQDNISLTAGLKQAAKEGIAEKQSHAQTKQDLAKAQQDNISLTAGLKQANEKHEAYKNKGLHRVADKLYAAGDWAKNNKGKTALGVGLGVAAIGGGIYAYKQYKNKPRSVIAKRIAALRGIYRKFMIDAQRNPQKAGIFKRIAAKILSVIDKLLHYMQNKADGR